MNWDAIGAVGEILGAIAVVFSLVYLAFQIKQSNRIGIRESRSEIAKVLGDINRLSLENPSTAILLGKLRLEDQELSAVEVQQADDLAAMYIGLWALINSANQSGLLPLKVYEVYERSISSFIRKYPGLITYISQQLEEIDITPGEYGIFDRVLEEISHSDKRE